MDQRRAALYRSLVDDAFEMTVVIRADFTVELASRSVRERLGYRPEELEGAVVTDFVHPDDLNRAVLALGGLAMFGAPGGVTTFRLRSAHGRWVSFDITAAQVSDGDEGYFAVTCRPVDYQHATDEVLRRLLSGGTRAEALAPVLDVFSWELNGAHVGISWCEMGGEGRVERRHVSTGIPGELCGVDAPPGSPWHVAAASGGPVLINGNEPLSHDPRSPLRGLADQYDVGAVWVVPLQDAGSDEPALVTVWTRIDGPRPDGHAYGMDLARTYIELILRWSWQVSLLDAEAHRDPLTGLGNRRALFDAIDDARSGGALLFCDLDRFKPINDAHGHTVGDEVLRTVARRIERSVRRRDVVARTGGDEFVVLATGITAEQAAALAQRIRSAVASPVRVGDLLVEAGVTIGVAHDPEHLDESLLAGADRALVQAKAQQRGTVRWAAENRFPEAAPPPPPNGGPTT